MTRFDERPGTLRIWFVALRPFSFSVSLLPVVMGTVLAGYAGYGFFWGRFCMLLLAVVLVHAAANLLNDAFDYIRGVDRNVYPVSGAVVRGWLTAGAVKRVAYWLLGIGGGLAVLLFWLTGWGMFGLMLAGLALALGYTRSGICLKYLGLGDPAILLGFGVLPVLAGWWTQAETISRLPFLWSVPSGLLAVAIVHANNWRDRRHDAEKGCRTLAVRIGAVGCRLYWQALLLVPMLLVPGAVLWARATSIDGYAPVWTLIIFLVFPEVVQLVRVDWSRDTSAMAALDARAARFHSAFTFLLLLGFLLAWWLQ